MKSFFPVAALFVVLSAPFARADEAPAPTLVANIKDAQITECSGLAASHRYPGLLWANNDSGDSARLFLLNAGGETVATVKLKGASARDWEDVDIAGDTVYAGDIGDNLSWRDGLQIYRFVEPELDPQKLGQELEVEPQKTVVRYPGKARDAETLLTAPDGRIWILSKEAGGSSLFTANFKDGDAQDMKRVGEKIQFGATGYFTKLATGGNFSPDGSKLVVTTYAQTYEWKLPAPYEVTTLAALIPTIRPLPSLKQCESVCYSADGKQIFLSSEGKSAPIYVFDSAY